MLGFTAFIGCNYGLTLKSKGCFDRRIKVYNAACVCHFLLQQSVLSVNSTQLRALGKRTIN